MKREVQKFTFDWQGITLLVNFIPDWYVSEFGEDYHMSHIEVHSINPPKAPLPITETGYKSHFTHPEHIAGYGGAVELVKTWLDSEAQSPAWKRLEQSSKQLSLF